MFCVLARSSLILMQAGFLASLTACQSSAVDSGPRNPASMVAADTAASQQLIVKFKTMTFRCDRTDIAHLSTQIDVPLEFVRPLSGNACVIRQLRSGSGGFLQGQKLLRQHPSVEWVELDAVMKTM
jgi:hypothetical protein